MQFQKTHKYETLISNGRIYIPTTGACAFGSGAQKYLGQSEVGRSSLFSNRSAWKTQTGVRPWCTCTILASVQRWHLASCVHVVSLHSGSMNINWEYSQDKIQMLFFLCFPIHTCIISLFCIMKKYKFYTHPCLIQCEIYIERQININSIN